MADEIKVEADSPQEAAQRARVVFGNGDDFTVEDIEFGITTRHRG